MADSNPTAPTPQDDADRIRLKRLAKLQAYPSPSEPAGRPTSTTPSTSKVPTPSPLQATPPIKKPTPPVVKPSPPAASSVPPPAKRKAVAKLDITTWEIQTIQDILRVTLSKEVAENSGHEITWLKNLKEELTSEGIFADTLNADLVDRLLIARLELNPQEMTDDLEYLPALVSLPPITVFEYLVGCWKRLNAARTVLTKKNYSVLDSQQAIAKLEKLRELLISYAGLTIQEPEMFPQPQGRLLGAPELVKPLLSLSALSAPLLAGPAADPNVLDSSDVEQFIQELAQRFQGDDLEGVLGPVIKGLLFNECLFRPEGLAGGDAGWRGVISGLELLVSIKSIAILITQMEEFNPPDATAPTIEKVSLLGPLCRLGIFGKEWPDIAKNYFVEAEGRRRADLESSYASLRSTLKSLQTSLFHIFSGLVRASPESREAVLSYFARVISLNGKRAGTHVDPETVASDSFMVNLQSILYKFADPFIDATYSKLDRVDPLFYIHSDRIDLSDETRIKATSEEANEWAQTHSDSNAPTPNFISNIFYLCIAMGHYGYLKTIDSYNQLSRHVDDMQRYLESIEQERSWVGTPQQSRMEMAIRLRKLELDKLRSHLHAYQAALLDPELVFASINFMTFLSTWLIRQVDPKKSHPKPVVQLPLPEEVPVAFRILPEYIIEDIADFMLFSTNVTPDKWEMAGRTELLTFILTFLTSTWYIKNPFLKSKINDVLFIATQYYGRERTGLLGNILNTEPMALRHLIPALTHFYIEVEQTGASSQFYDKFNSRRSIAHVLKIVWPNQNHRDAVDREAKNVDKFVRFVNLLMNDVTYLLDESLNNISQIHTIQTEMDDKDAWAAQPPQQREEREQTLRGLERQAGMYARLGARTVELLKVFTAQTKPPFMMPEIVDRLAAMLDYNLNALAGPRCQELKVRNPQKLGWEPRSLLRDIIDIFVNLSDQEDFIKAVANDGRSYSKELFERAVDIVIRRKIKTETEIAPFHRMIQMVEEAKANMEAEEDLGEVPDEYLDPLMFTLMRDPVMLPSSKTIVDRATIKSHLLSDTKDPFNRAPLSIEDVIPMSDLKVRIDAFLIERRDKRTAAAMDMS
ncbi:Ubiquitin conjugation factor E4 [Leucoagaricus sp. SymC.cos]|nr:Ubiquitin conjugation factor E4 [Leucoagaricus sp. SymC.cos]